MVQERRSAFFGGVFVKYTPLFLSPLGLIPAGHPALAGDTAALPPNAQPVKFEKFAPAWAGFYGGLNVGMISARSSLGTFLPTSAATAFQNHCWLNDCNFSDTQTANSALGGIQIGYNFQSGSIVYGLELDYGLASARTKSTSANGLFGAQTETGIDALGTALAAWLRV